LACSSGCGDASAGPGCNSPAAKGPAPKKPQTGGDDNFVPRPSPNYEPNETPPPRTRRRAPTNPPDAGPGANGPTGPEGPAAGEPAAPYRRSQGGDQGPGTGTKGSAGEAPDFSAPAPVKTPATKAPGDAPSLETKKPVGPPPTQQPAKKAPINLPDAGAVENGPKDFALTMHNSGLRHSHNMALQLQDRPTWSYAGKSSERDSSAQHVTAVGRIASTMAPTPDRLKSPAAEWALLPVESRVVRN
jgi:hypothetical protein